MHAESEDLTRGLAERFTARTARAFLTRARSSPSSRRSTRAAAGEAGAAGCTSSTSAPAAAWPGGRGTGAGVDVSIETCPHYLSSLKRTWSGSGRWPSVRRLCDRAAEQQALWDELERGHVDIVASDHSPAPP